MEVSHHSAWDEFLDEFISVFSIFDLLKNKVFICGSYNDDTFTNLQKVQRIINANENNLGFFEKEFSRTHLENLILKFDLIAKFSDEIIMIIEHDKGGHMIEMGIILSLKDADITEVLKKGGLLTPFFKESIDLFYFEDIEELKRAIDEIY